MIIIRNVLNTIALNFNNFNTFTRCLCIFITNKNVRFLFYFYHNIRFILSYFVDSNVFIL